MYDDMTTDMRPKLATLHVPVTLLYPWDPVMGSQAKVDAVYQSAYSSVPHVKTLRIDNSLHFIMLDQPQAFSDAIAKFLKD